MAVSVAVYGFFSFNKWAKHRYLEKRSDYADDALSHLEPAHEEILHLLRDPKAEDWDQLYAHLLQDFAQGRRKANRIGDDKLNAVLKKYESILRTIETNHIQRVDGVFVGKDQAIADDRLSYSIEKLKKLYSIIYEELTKKTLINADHF
ncbi:hypothetical protein BH09DEP1_BH09DEP1_7480 [soil metagenome]